VTRPGPPFLEVLDPPLPINFDPIEHIHDKYCNVSDLQGFIVFTFIYPFNILTKPMFYFRTSLKNLLSSAV